MVSESTALSSDPTAAGKTEPPASAPDRRRSERRIPTARETLQTLPEIDDEAYDFEPHDTIPAPPWLEDEIVPSHKQ
ncbi:MAG TPA: hypothetical protein VHB79_28490 [Polyangiaceae bacterium]|nr:hypothetical protein [Polyangiaceae bacterium]